MSYVCNNKLKDKKKDTFVLEAFLAAGGAALAAGACVTTGFSTLAVFIGTGVGAAGGMLGLPFTCIK